jgi:hypothetical protein
MSTRIRKAALAAIPALALMLGGVGSASAFGHGGGGHGGGFGGHGGGFGGHSGGFGGHSFTGRSFSGGGSFGGHGFAGRSFSGQRTFHAGGFRHRGFGRGAFIGGLALGAFAAAPYAYGYYDPYDYDYGYGGYYGTDCYLVRRVVINRWGDRIVRRVRVCD